jgi:hypothetical protein
VRGACACAWSVLGALPASHVIQPLTCSACSNATRPQVIKVPPGGTVPNLNHGEHRTQLNGHVAFSAPTADATATPPKRVIADLLTHASTECNRGLGT